MRGRFSRLPPFEQDGLLAVDKSKGWTSFDVVNFVRSAFNIAKIGHCGTLDPNATGLLLLVVGNYTKRAQTFAGEDKTYRAEIRLGQESDSYDVEGKIIAENDISALSPDTVRDCILSFRGEHMQVPPMLSARKVDGKKLYELGRQGIEIERAAVPVTFHTIEIESIALPFVTFTCRCSKGTYIRSLAHDIGEKLHCGALLHNLRRLQSGAFTLDETTPNCEQLKTMTQDDVCARLITCDVRYD